MGAAIEVREARGNGELRAFVELPYRLHRRDELWVPPLRRDVWRLLDREREPFFEHGDAAYYLALSDGRPVGRIAAIENRLHNEVHGDRVGFFGFFESVDDVAVAAALLDAAAGWCRGRGLASIRGPASYSLNHECGLLVANFDAPPTVMMPYNPAYYVGLLEAAGLSSAKNLIAFQWSAASGVEIPARLERAVTLVAKRHGVATRALRLDRFDEEVRHIKRLFNAGWETNWGYVPMTDLEVEYMAAELRPVVVPELAPILEREGEVIGFALALPDLNVPLRRNRGGRLIPGMLRALWHLKVRGISRVRILLLGVLPEFRGKGLDAVLYHWLWSHAVARGVDWGEAGWILEDNTAMTAGLVKMGFEPYRTYRLYERPIEPR